LLETLNDSELDQLTRAGAGPTVAEEEQQLARAVQQEALEEPEVVADP
jgi:hypothetical protein